MNERDGFADFVASRCTALVRYGVLLTADPGHGEDVVQDALVKTYRAWGRLHPDGDPEAYTRRVITHAVWRASRRLWRHETPVARLPDTAGADPYDARDTTHLVLTAMRALPAPQRIVLVLRYWAELSEMEIASQLHCSPGTVKSRASRAIASLRDLLADANPFQAGRDSSPAALIYQHAIAKAELLIEDAMSTKIETATRRDRKVTRKPVKKSRPGGAGGKAHA